MASPQTENGFTKIANEILFALARANLTGYERRFIDVVFIKTYGFHKKSDWISTSQIVELTGIRKSHVSRAKKDMLDRKIVTIFGNKIAFNKDYEQWLDKDKVTLLGNAVTIDGNKSYHGRGTQKKQDNSTKERGRPSNEELRRIGEEVKSLLKWNK